MSGRKRGSSRAWLQEHESDRWVQRARAEGYRSRASFKLLEIQRRDRLIRPGQTVVDLGAAPGGWSQVAAELVGERGLVLATDLLPMDSLAGVSVIQGDFTEEAVYRALLERLGGRRVDLVLSDMAPNLSGMNAIDQPRSMYLVELAVEFAGQVLGPEGGLVVKAFQGEGFDAMLRQLRGDYHQVWVRKPAASRDRSREQYLVARRPRRPRHDPSPMGGGPGMV